jgi:hypothetical protein
MSFRSYDLLNLVNRFGEPLTLKKVTTSGTYNPANGTITGSATTDYPFTGYFYNYDNGIAGNIDEIRRGTRKCLISASSLAVIPDDEDQITGNGDTVNILSVVTIFSGGVALCYICDVRE